MVVLTDAHIVMVGMNPVVTMTILEMGLEMLDNRFDKLF